MRPQLPSELEKLATDPAYEPNFHRLAIDFIALTQLRDTQMFSEGFELYREKLAASGETPMDAYLHADQDFRMIAQKADAIEHGDPVYAGENVEYVHKNVLGSLSGI